jgi:hypothetical protein
MKRLSLFCTTDGSHISLVTGRTDGIGRAIPGVSRPGPSASTY